MRIIAGLLGGRQFDSPAGHKTHPMSEKARGAIFNALGDISDLTVLDAFSGSGALSFEAVSRGAQSALAIENDKNAQKTIAENCQKLGTKNVKLISASAGAWLNTARLEPSFDIVLCDPPYDNLQENTLEKLANLVKSGGVIVLSLPPTAQFRLDNRYHLVAQKNYGHAELHFYKKLSN